MDRVGRADLCSCSVNLRRTNPDQIGQYDGQIANLKAPNCVSVCMYVCYGSEKIPFSSCDQVGRRTPLTTRPVLKYPMNFQTSATTHDLI